jgi:hypothetical protein
MKLRHIPTEVDGVVWDGSQAALDELWALGLREYSLRATAEAGGPQTLIVHTLEGDRPALPGDVVIRGTQGEWYPIKPDVAAACYEPVKEGSA